MIKIKYFYKSYHFIALAILIIITFIRTIGFTPRIIDNSIGATLNNNNVATYFKNSWTILTQISSFFYFLNFSTLIQSIIFFIFPIIIIYISLFNLLIYLNKNDNLSIILSFFIVLFNISIGSTDYPVMWISTHSFGIYSNFLAFYVITLFLKNKYFYPILISTLLIAVHPIVGLYTNCILYLLLFFNKRHIFFNKNFLQGFFIGWCFVLVSFLIFKNGMININNYRTFDSNDLDIYLKYWDYHRSITNYNIYFIFLQIYAIYILYKKLQEDYNFGIFYLFFICVLGLFLYLSKSLYINIPILNRIMISRFSILTSIPSSAIIINHLFYKFKLNIRLNFGSKLMYLSFFVLIIFKLTTIFEKESARLNNYYTLHFKKNNILFWNQVKEKSYGNILTCSETSRNVIINTRQNIFLYAESIDFVPYMPYVLKEVKDIIINLYGINFNEPPINTRNLGGLSDLIIKEKFENRSIKDWETLSSRYNFNTIIIPNTWNLKIKTKFKGPVYTAYFIK